MAEAGHATPPPKLRALERYETTGVQILPPTPSRRIKGLARGAAVPRYTAVPPTSATV